MTGNDETRSNVHSVNSGWTDGNGVNNALDKAKVIDFLGVFNLEEGEPATTDGRWAEGFAQSLTIAIESGEFDLPAAPRTVLSINDRIRRIEQQRDVDIETLSAVLTDHRLRLERLESTCKSVDLPEPLTADLVAALESRGATSHCTFGEGFLSVEYDPETAWSTRVGAGDTVLIVPKGAPRPTPTPRRPARSRPSSAGVGPAPSNV